MDAILYGAGFIATMWALIKMPKGATIIEIDEYCKNLTSKED